jgi:hypothetical protein
MNNTKAFLKYQGSGASSLLASLAPGAKTLLAQPPSSYHKILDPILTIFSFI